MKSQLMIGVLVIAGGINCAFATPSQDLLTKLFSAPSEKQQKTPIEVFELFQVGKYISNIEGLNRFPFGNNQEEYIQKKGIKSVSVNYRSLSAPSLVQFSYVLTFSPEGKVISSQRIFPANVSVPAQAAMKFSYKDGIISQSINSQHTITLSLHEDGKLEFSHPKGNRVFNKDLRLESTTFPVLNTKNQKYKYDDAGNLISIVENQNSGASIIEVEHTVNYSGNQLVNTSVKNVTGPEYYKARVQSYIFSTNENLISQSLNIGTPNLQTAIYRITNEKIVSVNRNSILNTEVHYNSEGTVLSASERTDILYSGAVFISSNEKLTQMEVGSQSYTDNNLLAGVYSYKYNREGSVYRIEIQGQNDGSSYLATVNSELTTYYDN